jgi:hypothetical protein
MADGTVEAIHGAAGEVAPGIFRRLQHDSTRDADMPDAEAGAVLETPLHTGDTSMVLPSGPLNTSRPYTRSLARLQAHDNPISPGIQLLGKLQSASSRPPTNVSSSRLEDAKDIRYVEDGEDEDEDAVEEEEEGEGDEIAQARPQGLQKRGARASSVYGNVGQPTAPRRSDRIRARREVKAVGVGAGVSDNVVASKTGSGVQSRKKTKATRTRQWTGPSRRSARLSKPLTQFHKYQMLPNELKIHVWEAAIKPRVVYIRNRAAPNATNTVQTKQPTWFMSNKISVEVAKNAYKKMFELHTPTDASTRQDVNPDIDVIVLEPCCNGCRGLYCTRHQFSQEDRSAVRSLAVQIDSPYLLPSALPCWASISMSWPNVETLYLMKTALRGDQPNDKALIRINESYRETQLRNRFNQWKKEVGKDRTVTTLEFVVVVDKETDNKPEDRYKDVEDRKTGLPEDIILG